VRLIDENGEMAGVMTAREAQQRAYAGPRPAGNQPERRTPVVKILDYGKFKYEQQKNERSKKKQKVIEIKEIKVRPNIDEKTSVKMRAMKSFIEEGTRSR